MREKAEFDRIFRLYYSELLAFALRYVADVEDCHDIVTAVYEDVWRNFATVREETARTYLYNNVRNKCIDHLRRQKIHQRYVDTVSLLSSEYAETDAVEMQERLRIAEQAVGSLKSPTREILEACYLHNKPYKEVAEQMNISISTVKKHMVRALKILRDIKKSL